MKQRKRHQKILWGLGILFLLAAGIWAGVKKEQSQREQKKQEILQKYVREDGGLIYGAHDNAPPLRYVDKDGIYKGVVVDYMSQLSLELGIKIRTEPYKWEKALQNLREDKTDFCDMFINEERKQQYVFSDPIYHLRVVLVTRREDSLNKSDLGRMRVATEKGDFANNYLEKNYPQAELVYVKDVEEGMEALADGLVDGVVGDEPIVLYHLQGGGQQFRREVEVLYEEPVVLAMPKSHEDLVPVVNHAIHEINKKGQLEQIQQKWFGISTPLKKVYSVTEYLRWIVLGIAAGVGILAVIVWNNHTLKEKVRHRTKELLSSRNELQLIFDNIPEYILMVDEKGNIKNANRELVKKAGGRRESVQGQSLEQFFQEIGIEEEKLAERIEALKEEEGIRLEIQGEIYELRAYRVKGKEKENGQVMITLRNITLDEIHKKQLLQSSKMIAIGQLAAGMAHQIRNPLSIIRMHAFMLKSSQNLGDSEKVSIGYIDESVQRAGSIIDNVLNFWRVSGDNDSMLDVKKILDTVILLESNKAKGKSLEIQTDCREGLHMRGNEEGLTHILMNLLSNAIDAIEEEGRIRLSAKREGKEVVLTCQDWGCGIPKEAMESLFHPFYTTKETGKGTGLGLYIVYNEVEKMGGRIQVESEPGKGSKFTLSFPQKEEVQQEEDREGEM